MGKAEGEKRGDMEYFMKRLCLPFSLVLEKRWSRPVFVSALVFGFLVVTALNMGLLTSHSGDAVNFSQRSEKSILKSTLSPAPAPPPLEPDVPRLAYLISGSKSDVDRLWRLLLAIYHPRNVYILHLDRSSPAAEKVELAARLTNHSLFATVRNIHLITKANSITYKGPTMVANTLHACAILLKKSKDWDWFINLSASDYPLVTQDDLLFAFSKVPRNLNFMEHTSNLGWKEEQRAKPMIIDPGLYKTTKSDVFWALPKRELPNAFKLFTGSAWMVLSREFVEFCIWGWDNLPRILLMYYTNFVSSPEGYFQTVICNSPEFNSTVVNHDLHYISWDIPPKQHPRVLTLKDVAKMVGSNVPFARKFNKDDVVLNVIDVEQLRRTNGSTTPGGWCTGDPNCSDVGDEGRLIPGPGYDRLAHIIDRHVLSGAFQRHQCR